MIREKKTGRLLLILLGCAVVLCASYARFVKFSWPVSASGATGSDDPVRGIAPRGASEDFQSRCHAPGVLKCSGFDSESDITPFVYPDSNGAIRATLDKNVAASGKGSLRFEIPSLSGQNSSGGWTSSLGASFRPGQTFYVQYRERFSHEFLKTSFQGNGWKQSIFHMNHKTCGSIELTTQNTYSRGYPQMYTDCGGRAFDVDLKNGDFLYEKGDYNCHRWNPTASSCAYYHPAEWMTFYYEVTLGRWGQPESNIKAWVAYDGKPYKQFVDEENYRLDFDSGPNDSFNSITLTPYNTGKPAGITHPVSFVWYDELVVSTRPIAAPAVSSSPAVSH